MAHLGSLLVSYTLMNTVMHIEGTVFLHLHNHVIVSNKEEIKITFHGSTDFSHWRTGFRDNLVLRMLKDAFSVA